MKIFPEKRDQGLEKESGNNHKGERI